jgi:predicted anti-sigma-YlaC factor YlaD
MSCKELQNQMVEALYDELDSSAKQVFDSHIADCAECRSLYTEMKSTLQVMDRRARKDPGQEFWDGYFDRLSDHMSADLSDHVSTTTAETVVAVDDTTEQAWWRRNIGTDTRVATWAYRSVAAAAILVVGIFAGRTFFAPTPISDPGLANSDSAGQMIPGDVPTSNGGSYNAPQVELASSDQRALRYVEKSQMLLLALVNTGSDADGENSSMATQKQRSLDLIDEAGEIKEELDDPRQRRLRELVSQLEMILREIANLESEEDVEAVEFIRGRVDKHDIMLKINLEQMRLGTDGGGLRNGSSDTTQQSENRQRSI